METILITGGTGFLGRNLALDLKRNYRVILAARNNERNNHAKAITDCEVIPLDVVNIDAVREAIDIYRPRIIIHAAATKYVDLSEIFPNECIDVNIRGSQNVARAAMDKKVKTVIGVSTDKAASPCNNMYSMSKAVMERLFIRLDGKTQTRFCCLRFGNIAWSTGSVFPTWRNMLQSKNKIDTTGFDMSRFFFSVHDAIDMMNDVLSVLDDLYGKTLAKKMKGVKIEHLLRQFILFYGGSYEKVAARIGERPDECMVGSAEVAHTAKCIINNREYYLIDYAFDHLSDLVFPVQASTAETLTTEEIDRLIKSGFENYS